MKRIFNRFATVWSFKTCARSHRKLLPAGGTGIFGIISLFHLLGWRASRHDDENDKTYEGMGSHR